MTFKVLLSNSDSVRRFAPNPSKTAKISVDQPSDHAMGMAWRPYDRVSFGVRPKSTEVARDYGKQQADSFETMRNLTIYWFLKEASSPAAVQHGIQTTSAEFATKLIDMIDRHRSTFVCLEDQDLATIKTKIHRTSLRQALNRARDEGWVRLDVPVFNQIHVVLTDKAKRMVKPGLDLETILLQNLPHHKTVALQVYQHIQQGLYPPHSYVPMDLGIQIEGRSVDHKMRVAALDYLSRRTGVIEPRAGIGFQVKNGQPLGRTPVQLQRHRSPLVAFLHYLVSEQVQPGQPILDGPSFITRYGGREVPFWHLRTRLAQGQSVPKLLDDQGQHRYALSRSIPNAEMTRLIKAELPDTNHYVEGLIGQLNNAHRTVVWKPISQLMNLIPFPKTMPKDSQRSRVSKITKAMAEAPIPLFVTSGRNNYAQGWLNTAVDYNRLKQDLAQLNQDPLLVATGALYQWPVWRMPKLYETQIGGSPELQIKRNPQGALVTIGLHSNRRCFQDIQSIPTQPKEPVPVEVLLKTPPPSVIDSKRYVQRCLGLLTDVLPVPEWAGFEKQSTIQLDQASTQALVQLSPALKTIGFQVKDVV